MRFSTKPNRRETLWGGIYLFFYIALLPRLLPLLVRFCGIALTNVQINFLYFGLNFAATTVIFRHYLVQSLWDASHVPGATLWYAILGFLGNMTLGNFVAMFVLQLEPGFSNVNDRAIDALFLENFPIMAISTVILAPITEELLFRGLIFRGLYDRSPLAAHLVSIIAFSAVHISGYIGLYDARILALCFLQYLPAAYCLNFAYRHGGSIIAPILMHMLTNLMALSAMR